MSKIGEDAVGCDFCERTSANHGWVIYECDECGADCCSEHSSGPFVPFGLIYCDPGVESGYTGCAPPEDEEAA